jgi:hypothetical protein
VHDNNLSFAVRERLGGGGSGISLHQPYSYDTAPGIHMRAERNKIFMMGNPATRQHCHRSQRHHPRRVSHAGWSDR